MDTTTQDRKLAHHDLWERVRDLRFAMLTTRDPDGSLTARPMTVAQKEFDGTLWFFTSQTAPLVGSIGADPDVGVQFVDTHKDLYVSLSGEAMIERDRVRIDGLWKPLMKAYFPKGKDDPDLALVRIDVYKAEYWDVKESKPVQLFKMAKAIIKGERANDLGEHATLSM
jgi:general stress protein 26